MTLEDYSLTAFTALNGARIVAYLPQIICVCRDRTGASSVSMMTWGMFCSANLATVFYALTVTGDRIIAVVFALNAIACTIIFALILRKRIAYALSSDRCAVQKYPQQLLASCRSAIKGFLARAHQRLEDRLAERHAGDRWSDSIERDINARWRDYRCGRQP
jgi:hypothetical protein